MDVTKPYEFIGFGAMDVTKPYEFIGFGTTCAVLRPAPPRASTAAEPWPPEWSLQWARSPGRVRGLFRAGVAY